MKSAGHRYRFGAFVLDPTEHTLLRDGAPVHLAGKDFDLLVALVESAGRLTRKEDLYQRLWSDSIVEEGNLTRHISTLRKALGDSESTARVIETVPRVGFRFVAPVSVIDDGVGRSGVGTPEQITPAPKRDLKRRLVAAAAIVTLVTLVLIAWRERRSGSATAGPTWQALAVLPFTTLDGQDPDRLGFGLTDGIITRMSNQPLIRVRPTSVIRAYGSTPRPATAEIARALDVDVVLDGHIHRAGEIIRVTVQLTDVKTGAEAWGDTFDQPAGELFRLEDAIAERVAAALRLRLAAADQDRLKRRYTSNASAYLAYLQGRDELMRYTPVGTRLAVAAFERALSLDARYALARAGLAMASVEMYLRHAPEPEVRGWGERAEREARLALDLDQDLAEAHLARAAVLRKREFDWDGTIEASRRALLLNPNLEQAHFYTAAAFYHMGLMDQSLAEMERGLRIGGIDRVEPVRIDGLVSLFGARFDRARERLEQVSRLSSRPIGDTYLALALFYSGEVARARGMLEQLTLERSASTASRSGAALASILAATGDPAAARRYLKAVLEHEYRDHHVAYSLGAAFGQLGDTRQALDWLRQAAETGFPCETWFARDPLLDPLRQDRDFTALVTDLAARREKARVRHLAQ